MGAYRYRGGRCCRCCWCCCCACGSRGVVVVVVELIDECWALSLLMSREQVTWHIALQKTWTRVWNIIYNIWAWYLLLILLYYNYLSDRYVVQTEYIWHKAVWCSGYCCSTNNYQWVVGSIHGADTFFNKLNKILKLIKSARICSDLVRNGQFWSDSAQNYFCQIWSELVGIWSENLALFTAMWGQKNSERILIRSDQIRSDPLRSGGSRERPPEKPRFCRVCWPCICCYRYLSGSGLFIR